MSTKALLCTVLLAIGCGGSDPGSSDGGLPDLGGGGDGSATNHANDPGWTSGTRLRAKLDVFDSARRFVRWRDTQLSVECDYAVASDGRWRCLPDASALALTLFDDAQCRTAVGAWSTGGPAPQYVPVPPQPFQCNQGTRYFTLGAAYTPSTIYTRSGSDCVAGSVDPALTYVRTAGEAPPATFVAATESIEPRGARLSIRQLDGEDGSRQEHEILDGGRGQARCLIANGEGPEVRCTPRDLAYVEGYFSDATCQTQAAFHPGFSQETCSHAPSAILGSPSGFYEVGAVVSTQPYRGTPGSCTADTPAAELLATFYSLGAAIPTSAFAPVTVTIDGSGRGRLRTARAESGERVVALSFYDGQKNVDCITQVASDGQTRCLPIATSSTYLFVDDACSHGVLTQPAGSAPPAPNSYAGASAPVGELLLLVGAKVATPTAVWQRNGTTCEPASVPGGQDFYDAPSVPPSELALIQTIVE